MLAPFAFSWSGLAVCLALYLVAGFGVTLGYHRLLTHRSFQTPRVVEYLLAVLGGLAHLGGPLQWVAVHRIHHQHSDAAGDPHSPRHGLWWVALLTLGEGWHNNHHAFPRSARHGFRWWELDATYALIRLLGLVGLARRIHVPGKVLRQAAAAARRGEKAGELVPS